MATSQDYLILSALLFAIGVCGVLIRKNTIVILMSIELMLNAVNLAFLTVSTQLNQFQGQIFIIFIMTVAAAEAAIGLAIIVSLFRRHGTTSIDEFRLLQG